MTTKIKPGITLVSSTAAASVTHPAGHPQGAAADLKANQAANLDTAVQMHTTLGQKIESVGAWLFTQLPGFFADVEAAIAAIASAVGAVKKL